MELDAFLADSVAFAGGKLYVHGAGWTLISVPVLPGHYPRIGVGVIVRVIATNADQVHRLDLRLEDDTGCRVPLIQNVQATSAGDASPVYNLTSEFHVVSPEWIEDGKEMSAVLAINIDGVRFERAGTYRFAIYVDGHDPKYLPFHVRQPA